VPCCPDGTLDCCCTCSWYAAPAPCKLHVLSARQIKAIRVRGRGVSGAAVPPHTAASCWPAPRWGPTAPSWQRQCAGGGRARTSWRPQPVCAVLGEQPCRKGTKFSCLKSSDLEDPHAAAMSFYQPQHMQQGMQQPMRRSYEPPSQAQAQSCLPTSPRARRARTSFSLAAPALTRRGWQRAPASGCSS